jgi:hypothetical protein
MTTFQVWRADSNGNEEYPDYVVEADRITYEPGFVVFRNNDLRVLRSVRADSVEDIRQLPEPCPVMGPDGYECTFRHDDGPHSFETRCDQKYVPYSPHGASPIQCAKMMHQPWIACSWIDELSPRDRARYVARLAAELRRSNA